MVNEKLRNKIIAELQAKGYKRNFVWSEKEIIFFRTKITKYESDVLENILTEMINEGLFFTTEKGLSITQKMENILNK